MTHHDPNRVRKKKCATCPFLKGSVAEWLAPKIAEEVLTEVNHLCNREQMQGKNPTWVCRGARNLQLKHFHRLGVIEAPTDEAWAKKLREGSNES